MAEIIKKGNKHKIAICEHCECVFSYLPYEVYEKETHNCIECPDCLRYNIIKKDTKKIINKEAE